MGWNLSGGFGRDIMLWKLGLSPSVMLTCGKQTLAILQIKAECQILCPNEVSETLSGEAPRPQCSGRFTSLYLAQPGNSGFPPKPFPVI